MTSKILIQVEKEKICCDASFKKPSVAELSVLLAQLKIMEKRVITHIEKIMEKSGSIIAVDKKN